MKQDSTDFRVKCHKCDHVFSLCELPAEISVFAAVVNKAFCPNCKAGPRHLCAATDPVSLSVLPPMTVKRRIREQFEAYSQMAIPASTPAVIVTVLRQAFLAGAAAGIRVLCDAAKEAGPGGLTKVLPEMVGEIIEAGREMDRTAGTSLDPEASTR